jgi:2-polyprenyl-3-methyl-5-hydroxy-6-metoxy-1,4-benzoquinol methylase
LTVIRRSFAAAARRRRPGYNPRVSTSEHWNSVYAAKTDDQLSWSETEPRQSLELVREVCPAGGRVIDVGGGSSHLAERLAAEGFSAAVLDVSAAALARARARLGARGEQVRWIIGDVTAHPDLGGTFDVWHDRAVFHFLTEPAAREAYAALLGASLRPGAGHAVIATFASDGPKQCSGLPVRRYDAAALAAELGGGVRLLKSISRTHHTPWGKPQSFQYSVFKRI